MIEVFLKAKKDENSETILHVVSGLDYNAAFEAANAARLNPVNRGRWIMIKVPNQPVRWSEV